MAMSKRDYLVVARAIDRGMKEQREGGVMRYTLVDFALDLAASWKAADPTFDEKQWLLDSVKFVPSPG